MDDQGAGGSSRGSGQNPHERPIPESSLPSTLLPHLCRSPTERTFDVLDWPNQPTRSRSQGHGQSLPSPADILRQTESNVILSRSLDASPVNPSLMSNLNLPPPRFALDRLLPPLEHRADWTRDRSMGGYSYPPVTRSMSTSPYEPQSHSYSHAPPHRRGPTSRTPQPPQPPLRQSGPSPGIQDVFMEDVGVLPQPEVPVRPPRDLHAELRHSSGFEPEQRRGRSDVRATHTPRTHRSQIQVQDHRITHEQSHAEGSQRDPQRQTEPFPSQLTRGTCLVFPPPPNVQCVVFVALALVISPLLGPVTFRLPSPSSQTKSR